MNKQQIVVNTIAFMEQVQQGAKQFTFFESLSDLGITHVEVRQEYFMQPDEFSVTAREAQRWGLTLLYSVPQALFCKGRLDTEMVQQTLHQAMELSCVAIKWTRGEFRGWHEADRNWMIQQANTFRGLLTVENDQTELDGTLQQYSEFLLACRYAGVPLFSTFDIGNWVFVGEDPLVNAGQLRTWVRYIHVKDVVITEDGPHTAPLGEGELSLVEVFHRLPADVLVALEYPCGSRPLDVLRDGIDWLARMKSGSRELMPW